MRVGVVVVMVVRRVADASVLDGSRSSFSPLSWQSRKLPRVARSSTSAEVQMASSATDTHEFMKQLLIEWFNKESVLLHGADEVMRLFPSVLILDSKNLFDAMSRIETSGLQLEEKRTAIEVLSIRERTKDTGIIVRWVDSDQEFADGLSKPFHYDHLQSIFRLGVLSIHFDPLFISAKKKRQLYRKSCERSDSESKALDGCEVNIEKVTDENRADVT